MFNTMYVSTLEWVFEPIWILELECSFVVRTHPAGNLSLMIEEPWSKTCFYCSAFLRGWYFIYILSDHYIGTATALESVWSLFRVNFRTFLLVKIDNFTCHMWLAGSSHLEKFQSRSAYFQVGAFVEDFPLIFWLQIGSITL